MFSKKDGLEATSVEFNVKNMLIFSNDHIKLLGIKASFK